MSPIAGSDSQLGGSRHPLQHLLVRDGAVAPPDCNAVGKDALDGADLRRPWMSTRGGVKRPLNDSSHQTVTPHVCCCHATVAGCCVQLRALPASPQTRLKYYTEKGRVLSNNGQAKALSCKTCKWIQLTVVVAGIGLESTQIKIGVRSSAAAI